MNIRRCLKTFGGWVVVREETVLLQRGNRFILVLDVLGRNRVRTDATHGERIQEMNVFETDPEYQFNAGGTRATENT